MVAKTSRSVTFDALHEEAARCIQVHQQDRPEDFRPRSLVLKLGMLVGDLCSNMLAYAPPVDSCEDEFWQQESEEKNRIAVAMGRLLFGLCLASHVVDIDLHTVIASKMELNGRKYPVELCKGKAGKYTLYSNHTGITKTSGQSTRSPSTSPTKPTSAESDTRKVTVTTVAIREFAIARNWLRYHTPRNIVLALMGELGELAELFQWKGDGPDDSLEVFSEEETDHMSQEFADVAIYLLRLSDVCFVDIGPAALREGKQQATL